jgi:hypothetical protein
MFQGQTFQQSFQAGGQSRDRSSDFKNVTPERMQKAEDDRRKYLERNNGVDKHNLAGDIYNFMASVPGDAGHVSFGMPTPGFSRPLSVEDRTTNAKESMKIGQVAPPRQFESRPKEGMGYQPRPMAQPAQTPQPAQPPQPAQQRGGMFNEPQQRGGMFNQPQQRGGMFNQQQPNQQGMQQMMQFMQQMMQMFSMMGGQNRGGGFGGGFGGQQQYQQPQRYQPQQYQPPPRQQFQPVQQQYGQQMQPQQASPFAQSIRPRY